MKSKITLSFEDQKKLYEKFSVDTLESLDTLYYYVLEEKPPLSFNIVYQKKYEENADNYNGRNEIVESVQIANIDISEITNRIDELSDQELRVISEPIYKAIAIIEPGTELVPKLLEFEIKHQQVLTDRVTPIAYGMLSKDIKNFFLKFSLVGLENFDEILNYTHHEGLKEIRRVKNEALEQKHKKYVNNIATSLSTVHNFRITDLKAVATSLTERELNFFLDLVNSASLVLNDIAKDIDKYKSIDKDFNIADYPVKEMSELLEALKTEKDSRPSKTIEKTI